MNVTDEDALKAAIDDLRTDQAGQRGYEIRPFDESFPSLRFLAKKDLAVQWGVKGGLFAVRVRMARDGRRWQFDVPTQRHAMILGEAFMERMRDHLDAEEGDKLWNLFVLQAARKVDVRLRKVADIDPPEQIVYGPTAQDGHVHEWYWTGTFSPARPFPVWHMRCLCGCWALLANKVDSSTGMWVGYDEVVHDIRASDGTPIAETEATDT